MSDLQSHLSTCFLVYAYRLPIYQSTSLPIYQPTQIFCPRNRKLLLTTKTLLNAIAPAASIGFR